MCQSFRVQCVKVWHSVTVMCVPMSQSVKVSHCVTVYYSVKGQCVTVYESVTVFHIVSECHSVKVCQGLSEYHITECHSVRRVPP